MIFNYRYFEKVFSTQDPWQYDVSSFQQTKYLRQIDFIRSATPEPATMLEIGCAEGSHTALLADAFPRTKIMAVDISSSAISRAKERCLNHPNVEFVEGDINALLKKGMLPRRHFDVVLQSESLYYMLLGHLVHFRIFGYVHDLVRLIRPGGIFVTCNSNIGATKIAVFAYYALFRCLSKPLPVNRHRDWFDTKGFHWSYELRSYRTKNRFNAPQAGS